MIIGLYLFVFAESVATLPSSARAGNPWPWPIGPLAMRFLASLAIAGSVGWFLVHWRPDSPTVSAFGKVMALSTGCLLIHAVANWGAIDWSKPLGIAWLGGLGIAFLASITLAVTHRHSGTSVSLPPTPFFATAVVAFIFVLTGLVGAVMVFLPELGRQRWPWDLGSPVNVQLLGTVFLVVAISALEVWRRPSWYGYDLLFAVAATFATIALVASFMHWNLFVDRPITSWLFVSTYVLGAILGFYPFFRYAIRAEPILL